jgi:hypothetical protein
MIFTLGCLSVLFGVLAMLWADGQLAHGQSISPLRLRRTR